MPLPGLTPVSSVIPANDEEDTIASVVREAQSHAEDIIVVDDASTDATAAAAKSSGIVAERQPENCGYIAGIKRGFRRASYGVVVTLDGDGELPASAISWLVASIV